MEFENFSRPLYLGIAHCWKIPCVHISQVVQKAGANVQKTGLPREMSIILWSSEAWLQDTYVYIFPYIAITVKRRAVMAQPIKQRYIAATDDTTSLDFRKQMVVRKVFKCGLNLNMNDLTTGFSLTSSLNMPIMRL